MNAATASLRHASCLRRANHYVFRSHEADVLGEMNACPKEESLFEAAVRSRPMDSSFWTKEGVFDRMCVTVEVHEEPATHLAMIERLSARSNPMAGIHGRKRRRRNYGNS